MDRVYLYIGIGKKYSYKNMDVCEDEIDKQQQLLGWVRLYLFNGETTPLLGNQYIGNYGNRANNKKI